MKELNQMVKSYCSLFIIALLSINLTAEAQGKFEVTVDNSPLDNSIRYGRLPNGFSYFIKSVPGPQSKLHLRFYNKAGYNQHDSDQLNIAHAVEHLAYKATQNFPEGLANSERIGKLGMGMYDYVAAFSGNRSTEFSFDAPFNNTEALKVGLLFFKDIAMGLRLTEADINNVRGELRQEYLEGGEDLSSNTDSQLRSKIFPCRQDYSNFLEYHETFSPEIVRRFYKDWYRPDLLAISAVGNIEDIDSLEQRIKNTFSDLKPAENLRKLKNCDSLYYSRPPQFFIVERPTNPSDLFPDRTVNLQIIFRDPLTNQSLNSLKGMERLLSIQLLMEIVNQRLRGATMGYNSFEAGVRDTYQYEELPVTMMVDATFENTKEKEVVQKIMQVINQLQKYGVTDKEWNDLKQKQHQYLETPSVENSIYWINEIKRFYDNAEALPANKKVYLQKWLSNLSQIEFNEFIREFLSKEPEDIGIIAPSGHKALSLLEKKVRKWIKKTPYNSIKPYKPFNVPEKLMSNEEVASLKETKIVDNGIGKSGAREFTLSNGLKLNIKPSKATSDPYQDNLKIHGFALKGASCFAEEDFFSIVNAPYIIRNAGVNGMDKFEINSFLSKNNMLPGVVSSYIDVDEIGIQGTATLKNLEILLQLIYLHITKPNKDEEAFEDYKSGRYKTYKNPSQTDFIKTIKKVTGDNSVVEEVFDFKSLQSGTEFYLGLENIDIDVAYDYYHKLFGDAKEFTFVVSGDFELESVLPVLVKYLGNLPNPSSSLTCIPAPKAEKKLPKGPLFQEISAPGNYEIKNVKYGVEFIKTAANTFDWQERIKVEALGEVSTHRAWELRFEKGYSLYSVGVNGRYNKDMNRYEIKSYFNCIPEEFIMIRQEVHQIISDLKSGMISEELFQKGMDRMFTLYDSEKRAGTRRILHQNLFYHYRYGQPYVDPEEVEKFVKSLTLEDIKETAKKYYQDKNFYEFVLMNRG